MMATEAEWLRLVESCRTKEVIREKKLARDEVKRVLAATVKKLLPKEKFGIMFSGGVDSTVIAQCCRIGGGNFTCYTVGFRDELIGIPEDIKYAEIVARQLGVELKKRIYSLNESEEIIGKVSKLVTPDIVNVGVGAVEYAAITLAKQDGIKYLFSGLGSEEIFAGYQRHAMAEDVQQECWRGLSMIYNRDLLRDMALAKHFGIRFITPFLDQDMIRLAMQIPAEWKLDGEKNKLILREAAVELGIPEEFAFRKKKAAQYGSNFDKAIAKLAKRKGFSQKGEYIRSLVKQ